MITPPKSRLLKNKSISRSEGYLPYSWKRSESFVNDVKSATDLSYKNTYGEGSISVTCDGRGGATSIWAFKTSHSRIPCSAMLLQLNQKCFNYLEVKSIPLDFLTHPFDVSGDQLSTPFELKLTKELPTVKQKTEVVRKYIRKASENSEQPDIMSRFRLPTDIVTKIYDKLHHDAEVRVWVYGDRILMGWINCLCYSWWPR